MDNETAKKNVLDLFSIIERFGMREEIAGMIIGMLHSEFYKKDDIQHLGALNAYVVERFGEDGQDAIEQLYSIHAKYS